MTPFARRSPLAVSRAVLHAVPRAVPRAVRAVSAVLLLSIAAIAATTAASAAVAKPVPEAAFRDLRWRLLGPFRAGWATVTAGIPGDGATYYFGAADGGVWRTTDAGVSWQPIFENGKASSVGTLAVSPSDPNVIWVGTGQVHQRWDIVSGNGVYRSTDGGTSWTSVGLEATRHIGKIWVDPRNADVALVAALGHVFGPNPERGIYRTEDGGKSWRHVLSEGENVGAVDLAADPKQPDVVYAALWEIRRWPWLDYFQPAVGAGSGLRKSTDGGRTWSKAGTAGWPEGELGRIALAVGPGSGGTRVWAGVEGKGLFRSDDAGASWTRVNADGSLVGRYMAALTPDPSNPDVIWAGGRGLRRSSDGGKSFDYLKGAPGGDDYHFLWIDPTSSKRMILGADQGAVVSLNGGASWSSWYNQPTGQFYRLAADDRFPYWIYSGQQDSGTVAIASRSDYGQLTFRDWHPVGGDERDGDFPDPSNPDIVYGAGLGGRLSKWDAKTGQVQNVTPWPESTYGRRLNTVRYRYDWITAATTSPRPPHELYHGAQVLFRSRDGGKSWETISPDLTGRVEGTTDCDRDQPVARATACGYGVIFAIAPSPAADGQLWIGTDNGKVQLTRDGGKSWSDVTPPGLADWSKVNTIDASLTDPATAYVAADRHRVDDPRPIAFQTHDFGKSWTAIGAGLPADEWVGALRSDTKRKGLLFAGTNRSVYVSFDDGGSWQSLRRNLPTTGINDLLVKNDDLIVATEGRAIWALDQIEPLRHVSAELFGGGPVLLPPAPAIRLRSSMNRDTPLPPEEPRGENPPTGAILDYLLPRTPDSEVVLEIVDSRGDVVRRFSSGDLPQRQKADVYFAPIWIAGPARLPAQAGHNRFVWDLRGPQPRALDFDFSIAAVPGRETPTGPEGALVPPGVYEARLTVGSSVSRQRLEVVADPRVSFTEYASLASFQAQVGRELGRSAALAEAIESAETRLKRAAADSRAKESKAEIDALLVELDHGFGDDDPERTNGLLSSIASDVDAVDALPTEPQRALVAECVGRIDRAGAKWTEIETGRLAPLDRTLAAAGLALGTAPN